MTKYRLSWPLHTVEFLALGDAEAFRDNRIAEEAPVVIDYQIETIEYEPYVEPPPVRSQSTRTVLNRLTDAEYAALRDCPVMGIQRAMEAARIEKIISEDDPEFPAFVGGCDALGLIAASRWDYLLSP